MKKHFPLIKKTVVPDTRHYEYLTVYQAECPFCGYVNTVIAVNPECTRTRHEGLTGWECEHSEGIVFTPKRYLERFGFEKPRKFKVRWR